ncbi:MAG: acoL [Firmicutes bacterium]|nr:acoL [Bacillota bacterium]
MSITTSYDVAVIGGGPGGYVAALRAAQSGAKVCLIEKQDLGGTCLNVGCIPTKTFYKAAHLLNEIKGSAELGIKVEKTNFDMPRLVSYKNGVVAKLVQGVAYLLKKNNVTVIKGVASFADKNTLEVKTAQSATRINAKNIIIAAGSSNAKPPIEGIDGKNVIDSTQALSLEKLPGEIVVIGGGVIGAELACIFNSFGAKVTVLEMLPAIVNGVDHECQAYLAKSMIAQGISLLTNSKVLAIKDKDGRKQIDYECGERKSNIFADVVLVAIGRAPNSAQLGLEKGGVESKKGWIKVNSAMQTSVPNIYAIGDALGEQMFAHAAYEEAEVAVQNILGNPCKMKYSSVPKAVFTNPEIGCVGLSEKEAKDKGYDVAVATFPLHGNGRALIDGGEGFVKIVSERKYHEILGIHIVGPSATELTGEVSLAITSELRLEDLAAAIHAHPTISEAVKEAALLAMGRQIHC